MGLIASIPMDDWPERHAEVGVGQRQPGTVIMSAGRALRIASAWIPARVLAAGAGDVRSVPGTADLHAGLDDVL